MVITMQTRLSQQAIRQGKMLDTVLFNESLRHDLYESEMSYRFSIGQLPQWAKKQLSEQSVLSTSPTRSVAAPKGRWAQRAENVAGVQSFHGSEPLPFPFKGKQFTLIRKVTFCYFWYENKLFQIKSLILTVLKKAHWTAALRSNYIKKRRRP